MWKILPPGREGTVWLQRAMTISSPVRRQPTFCVKVNDAAVGQAPVTQIHSPSFDDAGLAGVGFGSANQNTETEQKRGNHSTSAAHSASF